jgi:Fibronectin type III domain
MTMHRPRSFGSAQAIRVALLGLTATLLGACGGGGEDENINGPGPAPVTDGSLTVSWTPPTTNSDGSTLTNLAGYRISYGTSPSSLTQTVQITNPGITTFLIENLAAGTWYFSMKSYTSSGVESVATAAVSGTVR